MDDHKDNEKDEDYNALKECNTYDATDFVSTLANDFCQSTV